MKVRNGFVSNSSSSSFIMCYKGDFHKTVPPVLEQWLKQYNLNNPKNLRMLTAKVQEKVYETMSDYKRRIINYLTDQADFWFSNTGSEYRIKWKEEEPEEYKKHEDYMKLIRKNPTLAAEKTIQKELSSWNISDSILNTAQYLEQGYKVAIFELEHDGDFADENRFPFYRELHKLTQEMLEKMSNNYYGEYVLETDNVKIIRCD